MGALVVMGVSGCGKSSVASAVASALHWPLIEGDGFHSAANRAKMHAGIPLDDDDRYGWLVALGEQLQSHPAGAVLSCSALKRRYREQLRQASPGLRFAFLELDEAAALQRVSQRPGHFFPASVVASQFEALEPPTGETGVLPLDALLPVDELCRRVVAWMQAAPAAP